MNEIALISVALMAIANLLCFVILTDLIKEIDEMLRDIYRVTIKRRTIQEIAEQAAREARELFPCECDKEEEKKSMDKLEKCPYCGEYPKIVCCPPYLGLWDCYCLRKKCNGKPFTRGQHHCIIDAVKEWNEMVRKIKNEKEEENGN